MAEGHRREAWDHTAVLVAKTHNVNCTKKKDLISDPAALNPYRGRGRRRPRRGISVGVFAKIMAGAVTPGRG